MCMCIYIYTYEDICLYLYSQLESLLGNKKFPNTYNDINKF